MKPGDVTVIVPTYNALEHLKRTVASLEAQLPDPTQFAVVICNDGSTDDTGDWLKAYAGPLSLEFVNLPVNSGRAAARNAAATKSGRPLMLMLDGDMEFAPNLVAAHAAKHSEVSASAIIGKVRYHIEIRKGGLGRYFESRAGSKLPPGQPLPGRYFTSGHVSLPLALYLDTGGFDSAFRAYGGEDLDFGMRLVKAGGRIIFASELVTHHLHIRSLRATCESAEFYGRENIPLLLARHPELHKELRLDWVEGVGPYSTLKRFATSNVVFKFVLAAGIILNEIAAPDFLYDYLLFSSYNKGFRSNIGRSPTEKKSV